MKLQRPGKFWGVFSAVSNGFSVVSGGLGVLSSGLWL